MHKNPRQKEFFNQRAANWDQMVQHDERKLEQIVKLLALQVGDSVLDVGTGTGVMIPHLHKYVGNGAIVAVDFAKNMIEVAQEKFPKTDYPNIEFLAEDITKIPMNPRYKAILCYSCFPHFWDQAATILHLAKGLQSGGKLMIAHSQSRDAINNMHKQAGAEVCKDFLPTGEQISEMMRKAGLRIVKKIDNEEMFVVMGQSQFLQSVVSDID